jgi:hypothetical protein
MNRKQRRDLIKFVSARFEKVYKEAKKESLKTSAGVVPLETLKTSLRGIRMRKGEYFDALVKDVNETCDNLEGVFTEIGGEEVPLKMVRYCIDNIQKNFKIGMHGVDRGE